MKFRIIGPICCPPASTAMGACPNTYAASAIGYSALSLVQPDGSTLSKSTVFDLIETAYLQGFVNFVYAHDLMGNAEYHIGETVEPLRDQIVLASEHKGPGTATNIKRTFEEHCSRLRTSYIDVYLLEYDAATPISESIGAIKELLDAGRVHGVGLSGRGLSPDLIRAAHSICPLTVLRTNYSLWDRSSERTGVLQTCKELGIACIPSTSGEMEFIPKTVRPFEPATPEEGRSLEGLQNLAGRKGVESAQIELAWVIHQGCFPFLTNTSTAELVKNITAADIDLLPEDLALLDDLFPIGAISSIAVAPLYTLSADSTVDFSVAKGTSRAAYF